MGNNILRTALPKNNQTVMDVFFLSKQSKSSQRWTINCGHVFPHVKTTFKYFQISRNVDLHIRDFNFEH